jgi:LytS/YehU family sensor histidine kinase
VGILVYASLIGIVAGVIAWALSRLVIKWWFADEKDYLLWFSNSSLLRLLIASVISCWLITLAAVRRKTAVLEEQFKNLTDAASLHREAELFKLRQQLQPHFLYNSLNSINALIMIQPGKAQEMIGKLSDFLRNSVKREGKEHIQIDEELEYIEAYLAIETVRFGERLRLQYDKDYTDNATIPPFLLQPLLENAIKFGLYGVTGVVPITMAIKIEDSNLLIRISNPYDSSSKPPAGTGFGLEGIRRRLYLMFGRTDLLETYQTSENNTPVFTTILKIPQRDVQADTDR